LGADNWSSADNFKVKEHRGDLCYVSRAAAAEWLACMSRLLGTLLVAFSRALLPSIVRTLPYGTPHFNVLLVSELREHELTGTVNVDRLQEVLVTFAGP
jgi:hypothetical protein